MEIVQMTFGASRILWGDADPVDLGATLDGGAFSYHAETAAQCAHATGETPHRLFIVAKHVKVAVSLLEDVLATLLCTLSDGVLAVDEGDPSNMAVDVSTLLGGELPSDRLTLRPKAALDSKSDIVLWKAALLPKIEFVTSDTEPRIYRVEFEAMIDEDENGRRRLARCGDIAIEPTRY